jgi:hypothetical protein
LFAENASNFKPLKLKFCRENENKNRKKHFTQIIFEERKSIKISGFYLSNGLSYSYNIIWEKGDSENFPETDSLLAALKKQIEPNSIG